MLFWQKRLIRNTVSATEESQNRMQPTAMVSEFFSAKRLSGLCLWLTLAFGAEAEMKGMAKRKTTTLCYRKITEAKAKKYKIEGACAEHHMNPICPNSALFDVFRPL